MTALKRERARSASASAKTLNRLEQAQLEKPKHGNLARLQNTGPPFTSH